MIMKLFIAAKTKILNMLLAFEYRRNKITADCDLKLTARERGVFRDLVIPSHMCI